MKGPLFLEAEMKQAACQADTAARTFCPSETENGEFSCARNACVQGPYGSRAQTTGSCGRKARPRSCKPHVTWAKLSTRVETRAGQPLAQTCYGCCLNSLCLLFPGARDQDLVKLLEPPTSLSALRGHAAPGYVLRDRPLLRPKLQMARIKSN